MAIARVVSFEGVNADRVAQVKSQIGDGPLPDDVPATEILMLHAAEGERSLVIMLFENDEDSRRGDATLNAMTPDDTPGRRASVDRYEVALKRKV